jgi:hypothetical protein
MQGQCLRCYSASPKFIISKKNAERLRELGVKMVGSDVTMTHITELKTPNPDGSSDFLWFYDFESLLEALPEINGQSYCLTNKGIGYDDPINIFEPKDKNEIYWTDIVAQLLIKLIERGIVTAEQISNLKT